MPHYQKRIETTEINAGLNRPLPFRQQQQSPYTYTTQPVVAAAKETVNAAHELSLAEGLRFERRIFHALFALVRVCCSVCILLCVCVCFFFFLNYLCVCVCVILCVCVF
jgi:hypothetical protein